MTGAEPALGQIPAAPPRRAGAGEEGAGPAELVPGDRLLGPMPWVVAIMVTLTTIAAAGALALANVAGVARAQLAGGLTVQILEARHSLRVAETRAVLDVLIHAEGVRGVRLIPDAEVNALLSPWLGSGGDAGAAGDNIGETIPVPALIDAHLDGAVSPARLAALRAALERVAPAARIDAQANWLRPVFAAISALGWLALALIALLAGALAAVVLLAVRTAFGTHRPTIEIVHMLGGSDRQIARVFERAMGRDAALGGLAGFAVAAAAVVMVGGRFAALDAALVAGGALTGADWLALAAVPILGVGLAMATARVSVLLALKKML